MRHFDDKTPAMCALLVVRASTVLPVA